MTIETKLSIDQDVFMPDWDESIRCRVDEIKIKRPKNDLTRIEIYYHLVGYDGIYSRKVSESSLLRSGIIQKQELLKSLI